jgi:uncharacterized membrane protein
VGSAALRRRDVKRALVLQAHMHSVVTGVVGILMNGMGVLHFAAPAPFEPKWVVWAHLPFQSVLIAAAFWLGHPWKSPCARSSWH